MLKTRPLTQLLSQSLSSNVSCALLFTPSGSLLATGSSPIAPDAKKARTYAALAANIWAAYERVASSGAVEGSLSASSSADPTTSSLSPPQSSPAPFSGDALDSLTLELTDCNIHIQLVAPRVLLCLIGPRHSTRHTSSSSSVNSQEAELRVTPPGSVPRGAAVGTGSTGTTSTGTLAGGSVTGTAGSTNAGGSLGILKTQAQGLVDYLAKELIGYELPDGL